MKKAKIAYLRNHLSEMVSYVKEGKTVLVLDRDKPVAELQPYRYRTKGAVEQRLLELQQKGLISLAEQTIRISLPEPVIPEKPVSAVRTVLEDRSEGW